MGRDDILCTTLDLLTNLGLDYWLVDFDNSRRRGGFCDYRNERLVFSEFLLSRADEETVLDTIRHEVAHALAGPYAKHGPAWKRYAVMLGANPSYRMLNPVSLDDSDYLWTGVCSECGWRVGRHRLTKSMKYGATHPECADRADVENRPRPMMTWHKTADLLAQKAQGEALVAG